MDSLPIKQKATHLWEMKALLLTLALLLVTGCGFRKTEEIRISSEFSEAQQGAIVEAAEDWFTKVPGSRVPVVIVDDQSSNVSPNLIRDMQDYCDAGAGAATRLTPTRQPHISPCPGFEFHGDEFKRAITHELGHALTGTDDHLHENGHIMSLEIGDTSQSVTVKDAQFLAERLQ